MVNRKQIVNQLKKSLGSFDFEKAIEVSANEAQTRMYLIEPFFEMLRFNRGLFVGDLHPEYDADFGDRTSKKVDYAIILKGKTPDIVIECKKASKKLTDIDVRQLNEYFMYTNDSKIGILTNGIEYQFFTRHSGSKTSLNPKPFFTFNLRDFDSMKLELLAMFFRTSIDMNSIITEAEETYFLENFEDAFAKELLDPSRDLIKAIYTKMGGNRMSDKQEVQIKELINSVSVKSALDKLIVAEASSTNSGIITTEEEIKIYHIIKTIIAQHKKVDSDSIGYRDLKGKFLILLDDNQKKKICDIKISPNKRVLEVEGEKYEIPDIDSIIKLKKRLTDRALELVQG
jgi:hypothetical protein